jgi:aspartate kinase
MRVIVQKFGGTSLATAQARTHAIRHIQRAVAEKFHPVVVVSAMGRKGEPYATDTLLSLAGEGGLAPLPSREADLLMACGEIISAAVLCSELIRAGTPAAVLTGGQAGIRTNDRFGHAHILRIQPSRILQLLQDGKVVVVTGFQGMTEEGDFTTLGRGGSDTSAAALGAALRAEVVDIFTDVNGILTADPRIVEDAKPLTRVTYAEIVNMAHYGAKVIHPRAAEIAMAANIPVRVRSTFDDGEGTLVASSPDTPEVVDRHVTGIAYSADITQLKVVAGEGAYDLHLNVFKAMARHGISVDFINVNPSAVVYTVFDRDADRATAILRGMGYEPEVCGSCAKVSVIGGGMNGVPGIMASIVEALTEEDIQILQSADSNATIWVLVRSEDMANAVRVLHRKFELHKNKAEDQTESLTVRNKGAKV